MKALFVLLGLLLAQHLVTLQARTLHAQWAGDADATALRQEIPALLQHAGGRRASSPALALQLARLFERRAAAFDYRGPAESAPPAYMALANEIQVNVTQVLIDKALVILAKLGKLDIAMDVLGTYIAAPDPATGEKNACGVRLTNEMAPVLGLLLQMNYTAAVEALVNKIVRAPEGPYNYLGTCAPDLAAVLLALAGMNCPASGYLVGPADVTVDPATPGPSGVRFSLKNVTCLPEPGKYEDTAGSLLGAALMAELLLSPEAWLAKNGRGLAFAMTRMAFTVLQSNSFADCVANFMKSERRIPRTSFPLGLESPVVPPDYYIGPLLLNSTAESSATLCYATALISFKPGTAAADQPWDPSALVQVLVNVWLALGREMRDTATSGLTQAQIDTLCDDMHHILRFRGNPARTSPVDMFLAEQYQCVFNPSIQPCPPDGVAPLIGVNGTRWFKRLPVLAEGHDLSSELYACQA